MNKLLTYTLLVLVFTCIYSNATLDVIDTNLTCIGAVNMIVTTVNNKVNITCGLNIYIAASYILLTRVSTLTNTYLCDSGPNDILYTTYMCNATMTFTGTGIELAYDGLNESTGETSQNQLTNFACKLAV